MESLLLLYFWFHLLFHHIHTVLLHLDKKCFIACIRNAYVHITELTGSYLFALMKLMKRPLQAQYPPKTAALYGFLALNVGEEKENVIWGIE